MYPRTQVSNTGKKVDDKSSHVPGFEKSINIVCFLGEPPKGHEEFKLMIVGLNTCRLAHALRENTIIREDLIKELWNNPDAKKTNIVIRSTISNKEIHITEQTIKDVLLFGDASDEAVEYSREKIIPVLERMSYEGTYPPMTKKLLHPYWIFLAHVYLVCISGVVALVENWNFNYSKLFFDDMLVNVKTINKKYRWKFPMFLQMILDAKYPSL
ncbi:hypothetical protein Hanom_Chr02g00113941 [Helianthus anomalus]